jgi:hypothetical protein
VKQAQEPIEPLLPQVEKRTAVIDGNFLLTVRGCEKNAFASGSLDGDSAQLILCFKSPSA